MKLRFRKNSLRLRVNQHEAHSLAQGSALEERIEFPQNSVLSYVLEPVNAAATASFQNGVIRIAIPRDQLQHWETSSDIGIYFDLPASGATLSVALEKDLECLDGPEEERDPLAYPRATPSVC